jgi:hypothetical protein
VCGRINAALASRHPLIRGPNGGLKRTRPTRADHAILKAAFRRRIACARTLALIDLIIDGSNRQEPVNLYFDGDDLFAPFERRRGLPIGNLNWDCCTN